MPFHTGEVELQKLVGVHHSVMSYAPRVIRPFMPQQHLDFYEQQPFLVVAARDSRGDMWSTVITARTGEATLTRPADDDLSKMYIHGGPVFGDALFGKIHPGSDLGLLGIEFATRRRNRVNGRIAAIEKDSTGSRMVFKVDQSFGNCPQYIHPRKWWSVGPKKTTLDALDILASTVTSMSRPREMTTSQMEQIKQAQTIFVATGYRGEGEDIRYGNDASHRGGAPGFVMVQDSRTLILPEFSGNNHINSMGNLRLDSRMGMSFPDFEGGGI